VTLDNGLLEGGVGGQGLGGALDKGGRPGEVRDGREFLQARAETGNRREKG